jgi:gluconokinase
VSDGPAVCSHVLVMGVSGSGKSAVGQPLARRLGFESIEGDEFHPAANIQKMRAGIALTDADREPWLAALGAVLANRHARGISTVLACSALRRAYRDRLRSAVPAAESFVLHLAAPAASLRPRIEARRGHYMPASLLDSQLATLEPLEPDEVGTTIDATPPQPQVVDAAIAAVRGWLGEPEADL